MEKIRIQRNVKRIEVNDEGEYITLDFDDLNLPYRYYGMLKRFENDRAKFANELAQKLKALFYSCFSIPWEKLRKYF